MALVPTHKRWLVIALGVLVVIGVVLLVARSCGSKRASAPRVSSTPSSESLQRMPERPASTLQNQLENNPPPVQTQTMQESNTAALAEPAASETTAPADEVRIQVVVKPDGTQFYYKGKVIGRTPFILKQPRGEKRTYEVVKAGHSPRRLVVTGNEKIIGFELQQDVPHPDSL